MWLRQKCRIQPANTYVCRSNDGLTLLISSSDGFCSTLSFTAGELGQTVTGDVAALKRPTVPETAVSSSQNTPVPTPTSMFAPPSPFPNGAQHLHRNSSSSFAAPAPPPRRAAGGSGRPAAPARAN